MGEGFDRSSAADNRSRPRCARSARTRLDSCCGAVAMTDERVTGSGGVNATIVSAGARVTAIEAEDGVDERKGGPKGAKDETLGVTARRGLVGDGARAAGADVRGMPQSVTKLFGVGFVRLPLSKRHATISTSRQTSFVHKFLLGC